MLISILVFLIVLSVLVLIHELGHFLAAKKVGIWVEEFGLGLPPRVFGKKIGQTIYSVNWFPFGGFVRMHGEDSSSKVEKEKAFIFKSKGQRLFVVTAGVLMNFVLAIVIFSVIYFFTGIPRNTKTVRVVDVLPGSPAEEVGILKGDIVKSVDDQVVDSTSSFVSYVDLKKGESVSLIVKRGEEDISLQVVPRVSPPDNEGPLGVIISSTEIYYPPVWQRPFYGAFYGVKEALFWGRNIAFGLSKMIAGLFKGDVPKDVAGPVGIFAITTQAAKLGIFTLLNFVGILSLNLAILNIFPFPALDGGRLFFILFEMVFRRKVPERIESAIHMAGMAFLLLLLVAITVFDFKRLIASGGISGFLESFSK